MGADVSGLPCTKIFEKQVASGQAEPLELDVEVEDEDDIDGLPLEGEEVADQDTIQMF